MLDTDRVVLLGAHVEFKLTKLLIASLLKRAELKDQLFVALRLVS